jgi:uncharacterized membrane protein/predicted DsbA family dithiol-disulfide isomerase
MRHQLFVIRLLTLVALAVSAAQFADTLTAAGAFCSFEGDCEAVTTSAYGKPLGVPLPAIGLVGFGILFGLSLARGSAFDLVRPLAVVAGLVGVALLVIQFAVLRRVCPLCLVVDACAVGLAVAVLVKKPEAVVPSRARLVGWVAAALGVVVVPLAWSVSELPPPTPAEVRAHWQPGTVTVVVVTDFDCPSCRQADAVLAEVLPRHPAVRLVRIPAPSPHHEQARPAARAYVAARHQGKGGEMAAALYAADSRAPKRCRELAAKLGLDMAEYDRVVATPGTDKELSANLEWAMQVGTGVPMIWVQRQRLRGVPTAAQLEAAIRRARPAP